MKAIVALATVEAGEQKSTTALAKSQRKESLANKLMRDVSWEARAVEYSDADFVTEERAYVAIPRDRNLAITLVDFTHIESKISSV